MVTNTYAGLLEDWKVRLIHHRARRRGFRGQDMDDAVQQVVIAFLDFRYDESRSNGASEKTVLTAIIDRQLAMLRRSEARERQRIERVGMSRDAIYEPSSNVEIVHVVRTAVGQLSSFERSVCDLLIDGNSTNEIAEEYGVSWHTANAAIERIRRHLQRCGLAEVVGRGKEAVA